MWVAAFSDIFVCVKQHAQLGFEVGGEWRSIEDDKFDIVELEC
jgi:hypothetical protein